MDKPKRSHVFKKGIESVVPEKLGVPNSTLTSKFSTSIQESSRFTALKVACLAFLQQEARQGLIARQENALSTAAARCHPRL
jgi:hypothetical protein